MEEDQPKPVPGLGASSYSNIIRTMFLIMGVVLLISTAFLKYQLPFPPFFSFLIIVALIISAGLTSSKQSATVFSDFCVALGTFIVFGWQTFVSYNSPDNGFFWTSLILSLLSMFSLYYSTRTLRQTV